MSIRLARNSALLLVATAWGCGTAPAPHYHDKTYGQAPLGSPSADAQPDDPVVPADEVQPAPASLPAAAPLPAPMPAPAPDAGPSPAPPPAPLPAPAPITPPAGPPTINPDPAPPAPAPLPPGTLLKNEWFRAQFDQNSAMGINNNTGYKTLGPLVAPKIKGNLVTTPTDGLTLQQTFGDGVMRSLVTQDILNSAGDANRVAGAPSTSALHTIDRITGAGCPAVFICAERMIVAPKEGDARTMCFVDPASGKRVPFPYAAAPNYQAKDFTASYGTYGPFTVTAYAGDNVDCDNPGVAALATEQVGVTVAAQDVSKLALTLQTVDPTPPDYGVLFTNARTTGDLVSPYIDETVYLNGKVLYAMNSAQEDTEVIVVTARQSVDIAAQEGGGIIGGLAGVLVGLDGVVADLHFENCKNTLDPNSVDRCP